MRRVERGTLTALVVMLCVMTAGELAAQSVVINGVPLATTRTPVTVGGSMLLPMRDVFEALQSEVKWFAAEQKVMAIRGQTTIELWLGRREATINGTVVSLPVAPTLLGGATYVPLRFPAEAFGGTVEWQAATRTALIEIPEVGQEPPVAPPVAPPVEPPPVVPPVTPPAPVTFEGSVLQVLPNPPSVLVQLAGTGLPQAVAVAQRTVITRGVQGAQAQIVPLTDVRAGDYAVAVMGADNIADQLTLTFAQAEGKVLALANNVLVLEDGTAFRLGENVRVVDPTGQAVPLTAVVQNTAVTLSIDPASKIVWEIRVPVAAPPAVTPPTAAQVQILTVGLQNPGTIFRGGQTLNLRLQGTAGGRATVSVGTLARNLVMREAEPGVYVADWGIPANTDARNVQIFGNLTVGTTQAPRTASPTRLTFDSTPPVLLTVSPTRGETISNSSPNIEMTFDIGGGTPLNPQGILLSVNGRDVTRDAVLEAERLSYSADNLAAGRVNVEAIVRDLAGNEVRPAWTFTIGATGNEIIQSAYHDARRVLVAGDKVLVQSRVVTPGGTATYDIGTIVRNQPMQRVGNTDKYIATYTVKAGDRATDAIVSVKYRQPDGRQARMDATNRVTINTSLPTALAIARPADNSKVGETIVVSGEAPPYSRVRVTVTYRARVVTWVTGQLWQETVQANAQGGWETPEITSAVGLFGRADEYIILAELLNNAGATVSQQQVTVRK